MTRDKITDALNSVNSNWKFIGSESHWNIGPERNYSNFDPEIYRSVIENIGLKFIPGEYVKGSNRFEVIKSPKSARIVRI